MQVVAAAGRRLLRSFRVVSAPRPQPLQEEFVEGDEDEPHGETRHHSGQDRRRNDVRPEKECVFKEAG